jgi:hypothetical protein
MEYGQNIVGLEGYAELLERFPDPFLSCPVNVRDPERVG